MYRLMIKRLFLLIMATIGVVLLAPLQVQATHLRAGEITVERLSCSSLTFRITITVYTNTGSPIRFGDGVLDYGDRSPVHVTPQRDNTQRDDLGTAIGTVSYSIDHTYPGPGRYLISYLEPNRNAGILNMANSVDTRFYIETEIIIDALLGCNNSPRLLVPPIDKACSGVAWFHNPGAFDPDGDSISYELTIPKRDKNNQVNAYRDPTNRAFYESIGLPYDRSNEAGNGPPTFSINSQTGTITWDAPGAAGEYNISFLIKEWRKFNNIWVPMGYVVRDMQILVEDDCLNQRPELEIPQDICVEAGELITASIFGTDPDRHNVKIEAFSEVFAINPNAATVSPSPAVFQPTIGGPAVLSFRWQTACSDIKDQPYQVVFKITDEPKNGPKLIGFKVWNIRVVGPAPIWKTGAVDLGQRQALLEWESYVCKSAELMQVWRRVDQFAFDPPECVTGMPDFLGFTKIAEVPIAATRYTDTNGGRGLAPGAQYCYRLVAVFPQPEGGESYVSKDLCLPPILADAPVITNVTVDRTSRTAGQVTVKWRSPFDVSTAQFPKPFRYEVRRAEGFNGITRIIKPHTVDKLTDSTFVDTGLNTEELVYNYRVIAFDANNVRIDTSSTASTVRLEAAPEFEQINLSWFADVPWSNQVQDYPRHIVFRGPENATEVQLIRIDSVDVTVSQFNYLDSGRYQSTPLKDTETYCYRVLTRGAYGNLKIQEPLINYSQIACAQPNDDEPPCTPELALEAKPCDDSAPCVSPTYSNLITWKRPDDPECAADIRGYHIWVASEVGGEFEKLNLIVRDTFYIDANLPSFARCYKISAVDRAGNESELSEQFCFDNCPHYELPNVFTPNRDGCNDKFSAYSDRLVENNCGTRDPALVQQQCAKFVKQVNFTVLNRWGKTVYSYQSGGERSIYIDWDGNDNNGRELATGVYYYEAEVTFDVVDPAKRTQRIKGWVHLMR